MLKSGKGIVTFTPRIYTEKVLYKYFSVLYLSHFDLHFFLFEGAEATGGTEEEAAGEEGRGRQKEESCRGRKTGGITQETRGRAATETTGLLIPPASAVEVIVSVPFVCVCLSVS